MKRIQLGQRRSYGLSNRGSLLISEKCAEGLGRREKQVVLASPCLGDRSSHQLDSLSGPSSEPHKRVMYVLGTDRH